MLRNNSTCFLLYSSVNEVQREGQGGIRIISVYTTDPLVYVYAFMGTLVCAYAYKGTPCVYASSEFPFKINQGVEFFVFPFHPTIFDKYVFEFSLRAIQAYFFHIQKVNAGSFVKETKLLLLIYWYYFQSDFSGSLIL